MLRLGTQSSSRNSLPLASFALALLWLWLIAIAGGHISWAVHALLVLAIAIGFISLQEETGVISATSPLVRKFLNAAPVIRLATITRVGVENILPVPMHVVLSLTYLLAMFGTVVYLLVGMH